MSFLSNCMAMFGIPLLRFNYSNSYTPQIFVAEGFLNILEMGRYKEVDEMEDDINKIIYGMINGTIKCPNYLNIIKSYILQGNNKVDKTTDYLFNSFLKELYPNNLANLQE